MEILDKLIEKANSMGSFNFNITMPTDDELRKSALEWWKPLDKISVTSWNDKLKSISQPFELVKLDNTIIDSLLSEDPKVMEETSTLFEDYLNTSSIYNSCVPIFAKLISRSPKDIAPKLMFVNSKDLTDCLSGSMRTFEDLCRLKYLQEYQYLIIKEHRVLDNSKEFRVMVKDGKLNGISQYHYNYVYNWIDGKRTNIFESISEFVVEKVIPNVEVDSFVLDVLMIDEEFNKDSYELIEINPYFMSDPCLYKSYDNLSDSFMYNTDKNVIRLDKDMLTIKTI